VILAAAALITNFRLTIWTADKYSVDGEGLVACGIAKSEESSENHSVKGGYVGVSCVKLGALASHVGGFLGYREV
jgi:hypothetical protein